MDFSCESQRRTKYGTLREYMIFVGYVNENLAKAKKGEKDYEVAIRDAVNRCIAEE